MTRPVPCSGGSTTRGRMAGVRDVRGDLGAQLDEELLGNLYAAVSIPTERAREELRALKRPIFEPGQAEPPTLGELDATAEQVIARASSAATAVGGFAGLGGA